jgi:hypothetical protein
MNEHPARTMRQMKPRRVRGYPGLYREELGAEGKRYRIVITRKKRTTQEYFYFGVGRTEAKARAQAVARWKKIREKAPVMSRAAFAQIERRKSRTGIVGVRRVTEQVKGHSYEFWVAVWSDRRGRKRTRKFAVNKYGEVKARKLACKARREGVAQMNGASRRGG